MNLWIEDNGIRLNAELELPENRTGAVPLLILLHGFTGHMNEPHLVALKDAVLQEGFGVLRAELYGHGNSEGEFRDHNLNNWLSNTLAIIGYAQSIKEVSEIYLAGHSQGGLVVMLAAGKRGDALSGLIALSPAVMIPEDARSGRILGITFDKKNPPKEIRIDEEHVLSGEYLRIAQTIYPEKTAPNYKGPVLIVHGEEDEVVNVQVGIDVAKLYENAELFIVPGDNHCYDYHCDEMVSAVTDWLKKQRTEQ